MPDRLFQKFSWKDTNLKVHCSRVETVTDEIVSHRRLLEAYIKIHPAFQTSLVPCEVREDAPLVAQRMNAASQLTGLGPMASVAGALAQLGAEKVIADGETDVIVENGGDIFMVIDRPLVVGVFAGNSPVGRSLAFSIAPADTPLSLCSSSSRMGHSLSFGDCDLACALSPDAALADSVATWLCNMIRTKDDMTAAMETVMKVPGVRGVLAVKGAHIGMVGNLPQLVRNADPHLESRITKDSRSSGY